MQTIKNTIAENSGVPGAHQLAKPEHQFTLDEVPDLSGKVAVVTGGSEGIGLASSATLLKHGISKIFILSPNPEHAGEALRFFEKVLGAPAIDRVTWVPCDLSDWSQTRSVASLLASQIDRLDILLNVAGRGIMTAQRNRDDIDLHMALNHFGHVVLTSTLLPLLKKTADAGETVRIVTAGSNLHQNAPKETTFADIAELNKDYGPNGQYGRTKLAAILYARYLVLSSLVNPLSTSTNHIPYWAGEIMHSTPSRKTSGMVLSTWNSIKNPLSFTESPVKLTL
ncbi:hypothetical protein OPQ81_008103 [Rhizoctonia solani]|nr:hypothetical protein OPQ81_008103 [Rhizoctonia solani]